MRGNRAKAAMNQGIIFRLGMQERVGRVSFKNSLFKLKKKRSGTHPDTRFWESYGFFE